MSARDDAVTGAVWAALHENSTVFDAPLFNAALRAAGYAVVPVETTQAMCHAGIRALADGGWRVGDNDDEDDGCACRAYRAMIAAAQGDAT